MLPRLSGELDRGALVDRAIAALMRQFGCDYWLAFRVLVVDSIEQDVTVEAVAVHVLHESGSAR